MKKLMSEVLPAPMQKPESDVRRRVMKHMREAVAAGATAGLLAGCPFVVVDPMPPPARCKDLGSVKDTLKVTLTDLGGDQMRVQVALITDSGVTFDVNATVAGGTVVTQRVLSESADFTVQEVTGPFSFTIDLPATCTSAYGQETYATVRITVTRGAGDVLGYTVDERVRTPGDGGTPDGGNPDGGP